MIRRDMLFRVSGSEQPVRSGLGTRNGRFLPFLANPFEVQSIEYCALTYQCAALSLA